MGTTPQEAPRTTPLHDWHKDQDARIAEFGGYEMPLWYGSARKEHLAVLTRAGLFDTSHMSAVRVTGADARGCLQFAFTRDLEETGRGPLAPGGCVYGAFLSGEGHVIDDAILAQLGDQEYLAVVNAGMGGVVTGHLRGLCMKGLVHYADLTGKIGKVDLQGPLSARILSKLLEDPDEAFQEFPYFTCKGHWLQGASSVRLFDGSDVLILRAGYTGELGFELLVDATRLQWLWERVLEAGAEFDIETCGLAARDSLRVGACLPLSHQDIGNWPFINTPWDVALPWNEDQTAFTKSFVGSHALSRASDFSHTLPFVGQDLRKVASGEDTLVLAESGEKLGHVLTCATDVGIDWCEGRILSVASPDAPRDFDPRGLACGFVQVEESLPPGSQVQLQDQRRNLEVTICEDIRPHRTARTSLDDAL